MTRTGAWTGAVLVALVVGGAPAWASDDPLAEARSLYAVSAYERTLEALSRVDDPVQLDDADRYRALCLLALNRDAEAERVIERMVLRNPLPDTTLRSRSPKFGEVYRAVRLRLIPKLASATYAAAKASLESSDYDAAIRQFEETLELVRAAEDRPALSDLELVASEFRQLAVHRAAADRRQLRPSLHPEATAARLDGSVLPVLPADAAPTAPPAAVTAGVGTPDAVTSPGVRGAKAEAPRSTEHIARPFTPIARDYDSTDRDVLPPTVLKQTLPAWTPPWKALRARTFAGRLQIVVGEDGSVADAEVLEGAFAAYDDELLRATRDWRYEPARKGDRPVRYRRVIDFVLRGTDEVAQAR